MAILSVIRSLICATDSDTLQVMTLNLPFKFVTQKHEEEKQNNQ
jgi:hypothetical protein